MVSDATFELCRYWVDPVRDLARGIQNEAGIDGRLIVYWELIEEPPLGGPLISAIDLAGVMGSAGVIPTA